MRRLPSLPPTVPEAQLNEGNPERPIHKRVIINRAKGLRIELVGGLRYKGGGCNDESGAEALFPARHSGR